MSAEECICEFGETCGGLGIVMCDGCGGDLCVCSCGGEMECPGCSECPADDDDGPPEGEDF